MAAVSATLLSLLGPGDHLLTQVGPHTHPHARQGCRRRPVAALGLPASRRRSGGAAAGRPPPRAGLSQPEEAPARRAGRCVRRHVGADARRARAARHHAHRRRPARAGHVAGRAAADHQGARGRYPMTLRKHPAGPARWGRTGRAGSGGGPACPAAGSRRPERMHRPELGRSGRTVRAGSRRLQHGMPARLRPRRACLLRPRCAQRTP